MNILAIIAILAMFIYLIFWAMASQARKAYRDKLFALYLEYRRGTDTTAEAVLLASKELDEYLEVTKFDYKQKK